MKRKQYTMEDKTRILLQANHSEKSVADICREENISQKVFRRWKNRFGHMEINEIRRGQELERKNRELKQMLSDSILISNLLEAVFKTKSYAGNNARKRRSE